MKKIFLTAFVLFNLSLFCSAQTFTFGDCSSAANVENPFDYIGVQHNSQLEILMQTLSKKDLSDFNTVLNAEIKNASSLLTQEEIQTFKNSNFPKQLESYISNLNKPTLPSVSDLVGDFGLTKEATTSVTSIVSKIYDIDPAKFDYNNAKSIIMEWEKTIEISDFSDKEKQALYAFGSTLRYSLLGWSNESINPNSMNMHVKRWRWLGFIITAIADAFGAVGGTLVCGPGCGIAGGAVGSGLGVIVGVLNSWFTEPKP